MSSFAAAGSTYGAGGSNSSNGGGARIKSAAAALLKGGTLVSEPCRKCGGVQVKVEGRTSCINCGDEVTALAEQEGQKQKAEAQAATAELGTSAGIIEYKISELAFELRDEKDTAIQRQKVELLEAYLRILERMRALAAK